MWGSGFIGRGGYRNEPDIRPADWQATACPLSRHVRRAGTSAQPMCGLFHQAVGHHTIFTVHKGVSNPWLWVLAVCRSWVENDLRSGVP